MAVVFGFPFLCLLQLVVVCHRGESPICVPVYNAVFTISFIMQQSSNSGSEDCAPVDEFLLSHMLQRFITCKADANDLNDIAESLTASLGAELLNGNLVDDAEPPPYTDWHLCERLQPDEYSVLEHAQHSVLTAGYTDCMDEAIRFLVEEEDMAPEHPLVRNLKTHLEQARDRVLSAACEADVDNNNINRTPCASQSAPFDCYSTLNLLNSSILSNTG